MKASKIWYAFQKEKKRKGKNKKRFWYDVERR